MKQHTEKDMKPPRWRRTETLYWELSALMAGIALGFLVGVFVSTTGGEGSSDSYQAAREVSGAIGWPTFEKIVAYTADLTKLQELSKTCGQLEAALGQRFSILQNSKDAVRVVASPFVPNSAKPQVAKPLQTSGKYREGTGPVDINLATIAQIDTVSLMSTKNAEIIYKFIRDKGGIKTFDELLDIKGVGEKTVEKLRASFHIK